ncbi:MAG: hypothetical protein ACR2IE_00690 [Candidatus Sumerlaeaceae bacterium]
MIVKLGQNSSQYHDLSAGREYAVIGIEADDLRILNDKGQPYLYPVADFEIVDFRLPEKWVVELGESGEKYAYPPALNAVGFFEDFFERKPGAVSEFWGFINHLAATAA